MRLHIRRFIHRQSYSSKKPKTWILGSQETERFDCSKVPENEQEFIYNEILDCYLPCKEPSGNPVEDKVTHSELQNLMKDNIKAAVEFVTRCVVTGIVEDTIEDVFRVRSGDQKEGIKTPVRNMLEGASIDVVKHGIVDIILVWNVDWMTKSTRFMDTLPRRIIECSSFIMSSAVFVKRHVDKIVQKVHL